MYSFYVELDFIKMFSMQYIMYFDFISAKLPFYLTCGSFLSSPSLPSAVSYMYILCLYVMVLHVSV